MIRAAGLSWAGRAVGSIRGYAADGGPAWLRRTEASPVLLGALIAFAVLRLSIGARAPVRYPDTASYLDLNFLGGAERLWTVPLIYKLLPADTLRELAQLAAGIGAWSAFAWALYVSLEGRILRLAAAVGALVLGLAPRIVVWDHALLSESLSTSLLVLTAALLLRLNRRAGLRRIGLCVLVGALWIFTRQGNVISYLVLLLPIMFVALRDLPRSRAYATVAMLAVLGAWGGYSLTAGGDQGIARWDSLGIVVERIAVKPAALRFFNEHGLPRSSELSREAGS